MEVRTQKRKGGEGRGGKEGRRDGDEGRSV